MKGVNTMRKDLFRSAFLIGLGFYLCKNLAEVVDRVLFHVWKGYDMDQKIYAKAKSVSQSKNEADHVEMGFHA